MKNHYLVMFAVLMGFPLLGSARAETLNSKLVDTVTALARQSKATNQEQQAVVKAPVNDAEQQALEAEVRDAINQALENARNEQK